MFLACGPIVVAESRAHMSRSRLWESSHCSGSCRVILLTKYLTTRWQKPGSFSQSLTLPRWRGSAWEVRSGKPEAFRGSENSGGSIDVTSSVGGVGGKSFRQGLVPGTKAGLTGTLWVSTLPFHSMCSPNLSLQIPPENLEFWAGQSKTKRGPSNTPYWNRESRHERAHRHPSRCSLLRLALTMIL